MPSKEQKVRIFQDAGGVRLSYHEIGQIIEKIEIRREQEELWKMNRKLDKEVPPSNKKFSFQR